MELSLCVFPFFQKTVLNCVFGKGELLRNEESIEVYNSGLLIFNTKLKTNQKIYMEDAT